MLTICISRKARVVLVFRTILPERLLTPLSSALFHYMQLAAVACLSHWKFREHSAVVFFRSSSYVQWSDDGFVMTAAYHKYSGNTDFRILLVINKRSGRRENGWPARRCKKSDRAYAENSIAHVQKIRSRMTRTHPFPPPIHGVNQCCGAIIINKDTKKHRETETQDFCVLHTGTTTN